ncbi:MAG: PEGA domain-containing protein [Methanomicrobiales archaeon]|nr:PEGA domain-containing protein [Methanomicrobiales archaeon]
MVFTISRRLHLFLAISALLVFITGPAAAFTANYLDITVDENGDAVATFRFTLEGFIENAIPQSMLEEELLKGLGTSSEPPELISMDRSSAMIRLKKFAAVGDVPTGTEYRTVTMDFKKAQIALQQSAVSTVVTADFSPDVMTVTFPDAFNRQFTGADVLPAITHIIIDPAKAAAAEAQAAAAGQPIPTMPPTGVIKVISSPEGIMVTMDGNYIGTAPGTFPDISPGDHTLRFSRDGYEAIEKTVTVKAGDTLQLSVFLSYIETVPATYAPGFGWALASAALAAAFIVLRKIR